MPVSRTSTVYQVPSAPGFRPGFHHHPPVVSKFAGISHQVKKALPDTHAVTVQGRGLAHYFNLHPILDGEGLHACDRLLHQVSDVEVIRL